MGTPIVGLAATINASLAQQGAAQFNRALDSMSQKADTAMGKINSSISRLMGGVFNLRGMIASLGLYALGKQVYDASIQFQRIENTLRATGSDAAMVAVEYQTLRSEANRLSLDLPKVAQQFAQMKAAAMGTSMEGMRVQSVFRGIVTAMTALGASSQHTEYALYAVQQMISKGVVTMEELRRQLGDNLPGAFQMAAQAMGVSTMELNKMIRQGKVLSEDFLPKFSALLEKKYAAAAERAANLTQGLVNKLKTAAFEFRNFIAESGLGPAFDNAIRKITDILKSNELKEAARKLGDDLAAAINLSVKAFGFLATHASTALHVLEAYAGLKIITFFTNLAVEINRVKNALIELEIVQRIFNASRGSSNVIAGLAGAPVNAGGGIAAAAIGSAAGRSIPQQVAQYFAKNGKLLNASQFAMKSASANFTGSAAEYSALSMLFGKGGNILNQSALNARIAGQAFQNLDFTSKKLVQSMGQLYSMDVKLGARAYLSASAFKHYANSLMGIFILKPWTWFSNMGVSLGVVWSQMTRVLAMIPGWGWIAAAILAAAGALYYFRDAQITIQGNTAKLKSYMGVAWDFIKEVGQGAWKSIKEEASDFFQAIKPWIDTLKTAWDGLVSSMKTALDFYGITDFFGKWAALAQARENTQKNQANHGKTDPITGRDLYWLTMAPGVPSAYDGKYHSKEMTTPKPSMKPEDKAPKIDQLGQLTTRYSEELTMLKALTDQTFLSADAEEQLRKQKQFSIEWTNLYNKSTKEQKAEMEALKPAMDWVIQQIGSLTARQKSLHTLREETLRLDQEIPILEKENTELMSRSASRRIYQTLEEKQALIDLNAERYAAVKTAGLVGLQDKELLDLQAKLRREYTDKAVNDHLKSLEDFAARIRDNTDAVGRYNDIIKRLTEARNLDKLSVDEYNKAVRDLKLEFDDMIDNEMSKSKNWADGIKLALRQISREAHQTALNFRDAFANVYNDLEDRFTNLLDKGEFGFKDFIQTIRHEINKLLVRSLMGQLSDVLLGKKNQDTSNGGGGTIFGSGTGIFGAVLDKIFKMPNPGQTPPFVGKQPMFLDPNTGKEIWVKAGNEVQNSWQGMANKVGMYFKDMLGGVGKFFYSIFARLISGGGGFLQTLTSSIGGIFGKVFHIGSSGTTNNGAYQLPPGVLAAANGGIISSRGMLPLNKFSSGGIAYGPQMAMFGEGRRPEAYVPLPDGRRIPVALQGMPALQGQTQHNVKVVLINRSQQPVQASEGRKFYDPTLKEIVTEIILDDRINNGPLRRAGFGGQQ